MPIVQQDGPNSDNAAVETRSATFPGTPTEGNTLVFMTAAEGTDPVTIDEAGWVNVFSVNKGTTEFSVWEKIAGSSEGLTVTARHDAQELSVFLFESDIGTGVDVSSSVGDNDTGLSMTSAALTPSEDGADVVVFLGNSDQTTAPEDTWTNGFAEIGAEGSDVSMMVGYLSQVTAASISTTEEFTPTVTRRFAGAVAISPAGGGGGGDRRIIFIGKAEDVDKGMKAA